ncbi:MAG: N-6 DNA methylase, partial [SAR324 cluster bacterium]|nr:N-6 DNA methylase [SAR324 cluster bacterium]
MHTFARSLRENFTAHIAAQPEDQLKSPLKILLETAGPVLGYPPVIVRTETPLPGIGRPDAGVAVGKLLCGHVELKPPGTGARPERFISAHDKEQWKHFKALPNLLYTDGNEWALYRSGKQAGKIVRFSGDVTADGEDAVTPEQADRLADVLRLFLAWEPIVPSKPKELAELLAPLCRMLRDTVQDALQREDSALRQLAGDWRRLLFPLADDRQFADAYAQTLTYALLLARFEGATEPDATKAAATLDSGHGLLAQALRVLADPQVRPEIETPAEVLERAIFAVDVKALRRSERELWLYFYEDFLAAYDAKLRKDSGVYYTPAEVVQAQITLVAQLLRERFDKPLAFADDDVVFLDPAAGTGTYLLAAMQHGLELVRRQYGEGAVSGRATMIGRNMHAFELLVGPYAVAHLRLTRELLDAAGALPPEGAHVYLTDTLETPHREPPGQQ